jgi:hypothetical protein
MLSYAMVDGFTDEGDAMRRLKEAIAEVRGMIVDFALYANVKAIRMSVEVEARELSHLGRALEARDVRLFERSAAEIAGADRVVPPSTPVIALVHVTLTCSA